MTFSATGDFNQEQQLVADFKFGTDKSMIITFTGSLINLTLNGVYDSLKEGGKTFRYMLIGRIDWMIWYPMVIPTPRPFGNRQGYSIHRTKISYFGDLYWKLDN